MTHLEQFQAAVNFPLDDFQVDACRSIEEGHGVLVCAPTGAGKTIVGEFGVYLASAHGTKCFYTTPIKALSNQKYHDLCAAHGEENVGLLTGDVSINHNADIVVMTTEVLRNMIYAESDALDRLEFVVMDEIHFLSDKSRGAVWEEVILNLDESVSVIGLSATVSNSEEFGNWLTTVRGDTKVIVTDKRPVPLNQWMLVGRKLHPLFDEDNVTLNSNLASHIERLEDQAFKTGFGGRSGRGRPDKHQPLSRVEVLEILQQHDMLPAITFIFSRAGCDGALYQCLRSRLVLTTEEESKLIAQIIEEGVRDIPEEDLKVLDYGRWRSALMRGFAAHHAGMLPAFRHIVEKLFVKGLIKAVFATETLALGINMPARTVVLEKLVKYDGEAHVDLTPGQYTQLTGRAGRRGIDTIGNAVVMWVPAIDARAVAGLASTRTYPLNSTFEPGYNMSVNLLKTIGYEAAHRLIEKSFAQFQADGSVVDVARDLERADNELERETIELQALIHKVNPPSDDPIAEFLDYMDLRRKLTEAEKRAKKFATEQRGIEITRALSKLQIGDVIALPGKKKPVLAVVVQPASNRHDPKPWITMESGWSGRLSSSDIGIPPVNVGHMRLPRAAITHPRRNSRQVVTAFARNAYKRPKKLRHEARLRPTKEITALRLALREHPSHQWVGREEMARHGEKLLRARRKRDALKLTIENATDTLGKTFDRILDLLGELDYVEFEAGTPTIAFEGERLAEIHNESDLLVAQCLRRGIWEDLDPAELAGVVSMCTFENRRETKGQANGATDRMIDAMENTDRLWTELSSDERRHRLPLTKIPDPAFALSIHQWAAGAPLGYCLAAAADCGTELTPGDFVRQARQVVDLLEQIRGTGYSDEIRNNARLAIEAIRRGVVAIGS